MRPLYWLIPALALFSSHPAVAQGNYPDRPIKMIVPLAAASAVDVAARIVTQKMADNMGQQFVILNQPGASGLIGAEAVARAEPDGYTIGGFNDSIMNSSACGIRCTEAARASPTRIAPTAAPSTLPSPPITTIAKLRMMTSELRPGCIDIFGAVSAPARAASRTPNAKAIA